MTTGDAIFNHDLKPTVEEVELLVRIKENQAPFEDVAEMIERGVAELAGIQEKSTLRDQPDQDWIDDFIFRVYAGVVRGEV